MLNLSVNQGLLIEVCFMGMVFLHDLFQHIPAFLGLYGAACLSYGAAVYWLLATTVHPWYVTLIIPLLPFLASHKGKASRTNRFLLFWLYFSAIIPLSYLTYLDPDNLSEYAPVRLVEYVPLYVLLIWSVWPASGDTDEPGTD